MNKIFKISLLSGSISFFLLAASVSGWARANTMDGNRPYESTLSSWGSSSAPESVYPVAKIVLKSSTSVVSFSITFAPIENEPETNAYVGYKEEAPTPALDVSDKDFTLRDEIMLPKGALKITIHQNHSSVVLQNAALTLPINGVAETILENPTPYSLRVKIESHYSYKNDGTWTITVYADSKDLEAIYHALSTTETTALPE